MRARGWRPGPWEEGTNLDTPIPRRWVRTAVHEAGHAVAAALLDVPFSYVALAPCSEWVAGGGKGRIRRGHVYGLPLSKDYDRPGALVQVILGGPEASHLQYGTRTSIRRGDGPQARLIARWAAERDERGRSADRIYRQARADVRKLLQENWHRVLLVMVYLLGQGTLSQDQVSRVCALAGTPPKKEDGMEEQKQGHVYGFIELGVTAYGRLCDALEAEPDLSGRLGVRFCPACGDLYATNELCRYLCSLMREDPDGEE